MTENAQLDTEAVVDDLRELSEGETVAFETDGDTTAVDVEAEVIDAKAEAGENELYGSHIKAEAVVTQVTGRKRYELSQYIDPDQSDSLGTISVVDSSDFRRISNGRVTESGIRRARDSDT